MKWKGPYGRSDKAEKYPSTDNLKYDVVQASTVGCDVVVFLVFNDFSTGQNTDGHKYSGFAVGAPCEASQASGYTVVSSRWLIVSTSEPHTVKLPIRLAGINISFQFLWAKNSYF